MSNLQFIEWLNENIEFCEPRAEAENGTSGNYWTGQINLLRQIKEKFALESPSSIEGKEKISGIDLIAKERRRQVEVEGWTAEHDATHQQGEMAMAAAVYAWPESYMSTGAPRCAIITKQEFWPWDEKWYKPGTRISDLVKAGALIAAEIDNQLRLSPLESPSPVLPVKEEEKK
jgi:hypothetical protein